VRDRTVLEAVEKVQARIEELRQAKVGSQQLQLKFGDHSNLRATDVAESPTDRGRSHLVFTAGSGVLNVFQPTGQQLVTTTFRALW
jgi:hypothetical protein